MALGAQHGSIYRMVMKEAGWLAAAGVVLGAASAIAAATMSRNLLFGVSSWDAQTIIAVAVILGAAAMLASFVPAKRAARVNPVEALRTE